jgi:predicted DNA-binding transcriptional regulator YafY
VDVQQDRLQRILRLISLVNSQTGFNARSLAEKLNCSKRSVYRDIQVIQKAGYRLYHDPDYSEGGAYRFRDQRRVLRSGLADPFRHTPEDGGGTTVEIEFAAETAGYVRDCCCHPNQTVRHHPSGRVTLSMVAGDLDDLAWWVLGFGPRAKVTKPRELATVVRDLAEQTVSRYATVGPRD